MKKDKLPKMYRPDCIHMVSKNIGRFCKKGLDCTLSCKYFKFVQKNHKQMK